MVDDVTINLIISWEYFLEKYIYMCVYVDRNFLHLTQWIYFPLFAMVIDVSLLQKHLTDMSIYTFRQAKIVRTSRDQKLGALNQTFLFANYLPFSESSKRNLPVEYHVYVWCLSGQLNCGDVYQSLIWFNESNIHFTKAELSVYQKLRNDVSVTHILRPMPSCWCLEPDYEMQIAKPMSLSLLRDMNWALLIALLFRIIVTFFISPNTYIRVWNLTKL